MEKLIERRDFPNFVKASYGSRIIAFLIDLVIIYSLYRVLNPVFNLFNIERSSRFLSPYKLGRLGIYLGYFFISNLIMDGQSLGKAMLGLRVYSLDREILSAKDIFFREIVSRYIQKVLGFLYLMGLFTADRQTFADMVAGTVVIDEKSIVDYEELLRIREQERISDCKDSEVTI